MLKKTLISTLHFYNNYGSILQAFALKKVIGDDFGADVDFLPFRPALPEYRYFDDGRLTQLFGVKEEKYTSFRTNVLGIPTQNRSDLNSAFELLDRDICDYDAFIAGSDIIWGREFSGLADPYFLTFAEEDKPRIAYAASVILENNGKVEDEILFSDRLSHFSAIGMRETSAVDTISKLAGDVPVSAVLDPTLLLEREDYESIEALDVELWNGDLVGIPDEPYLLSYFLTHDPAVVDYTNLMARKFGLRIVHYFADYPDRVFPSDAQCFAFTGPGEFLSLMRNASMIFTNSFHGTCFSMIYRKPFYTYMAKRGMLSRVRDTVDRLGMQDRYFTDFRDMNRVTMEIDYSEMEKKLASHRESSISFLKKTLEATNV